jgi:hypothetical protein
MGGGGGTQCSIWHVDEPKNGGFAHTLPKPTCIINLPRVLCLCVCVTIAERWAIFICFSNQTDQGDETEGLEMEGLEMEIGDGEVEEGGCE